MSTFIDEKALRMVFSPSYLSHVEGWFGYTVCGRWINHSKGWRTGALTSFAWLGKISQRPKANYFCTQCAASFRDFQED